MESEHGLIAVQRWSCGIKTTAGADSSAHFQVQVCATAPSQLYLWVRSLCITLFFPTRETSGFWWKKSWASVHKRMWSAVIQVYRLDSWQNGDPELNTQLRCSYWEHSSQKPWDFTKKGALVSRWFTAFISSPGFRHFNFSLLILFLFKELLCQPGCFGRVAIGWGAMALK